MAAESKNAALVGDREIAAVRVFDAPRDLVWKVWTEPEHIAQWWGPKGFTTTTHKMEVKPGGVWRFVMHGPERDYQNKITYLEVVKPERLVYDHGDDGQGEACEHWNSQVLPAPPHPLPTLPMEGQAHGGFFHLPRLRRSTVHNARRTSPRDTFDAPATRSSKRIGTSTIG